MKLFSKAAQFMQIAYIEYTDERAFDAGLEVLKDKAPDILGYAGARVKLIKTGPATGILIAETKNREALGTYASMTADMFDEQAEKFGMKSEPHDGEVIWST